jgi:hypothetical protein
MAEIATPIAVRIRNEIRTIRRRKILVGCFEFWDTEKKSADANQPHELLDFHSWGETA